MPRSDRQPRQRLDPAERRSAIVAAASDAFAGQPYEHVSLARIAAGAGASEALVYRYFDGKAGLYAEVVQRAVERFTAREAAAQAALPEGVPARDRVRASLVVYLDHVAEHPAGWSAPLLGTSTDPEPAAGIRRRARRDRVEQLRALLRPTGGARSEAALWGYLGFVDAACLQWVATGCPGDDRWALVDAALGALEGALGDWSR